MLKFWLGFNYWLLTWPTPINLNKCLDCYLHHTNCSISSLSLSLCLSLSVWSSLYLCERASSFWRMIIVFCCHGKAIILKVIFSFFCFSERFFFFSVNFLIPTSHLMNTFNQVLSWKKLMIILNSKPKVMPQYQ